MRKLFLPLLLFFSVSLFGQDNTIKALQADAGKTIAKDAADTSKKTWKKGGLYGINVGQGSLSNWAAGGDEFSLSINSFLSLFAFYQKGKNSWDNSLDFNLGYVNTTSLGSRKNDDRFDFVSKYGYAIAPKWNFGALFNFRTQFFKGYNYPSSGKVFTSEFLSPAYLLLSLGFDYKPNKDLSIFLSPLTSRWIIVNNDSLNAKGLYGVSPGKKSVNEIGAFASVNYLKALGKNVTFKSKLDLFSNYKRNPQNVDVFMTNLLSAKISKAISFNWNLDFIYDDDVRLFGANKSSPALQIKSILGLGVSVKL